MQRFLNGYADKNVRFTLCRKFELRDKEGERERKRKSEKRGGGEREKKRDRPKVREKESIIFCGGDEKKYLESVLHVFRHVFRQLWTNISCTVKSR